MTDLFSSRTSQTLRAVLIALCMAALYFGVARLTFLLPIGNVPGNLLRIAIWPAAAVAFAGYWYYGLPALAGAFVGTLLLHYSFDWTMSPLKLMTSVANVLPPLLSCWLLRRAGVRDLFGSTRAVLRFVLYAALLAPLCNALVSLLALRTFRPLPPGELLPTVALWWSVEALAMLLVTPAIMTWRDWLRLSPRRWVELLALVAAIVFVFRQLFLINEWSWLAPFALLLLPPVYAALFRFNFGVMAGVSLLISLLGIAATSTALNADPLLRDRYFYLLAFLTVQALFNIIMCAAMAALQRTFERLTTSEERFRAMFEQAAVGIVLHEVHTGRHTVNRRLAEMFGYREDELGSLDQRDLLLPEDLPIAEAHSLKVMNGELPSLYQELRYHHRDGHVLWMGLTLSMMRSQLNNADFIIGLFQDIGARKSAEAAAERLALYDYLTGLPNRRLFGDRLQKALVAAQRSGDRGALIYIDLDNFKRLNDAHGHSVGDDMLIKVARRLQDALRLEDTVARLGGDEFVVLLQHVGSEQAAAEAAVWAIARKLLAAFREPFVLGTGVEFVATASIGVTLFPKGSETAEELLKEADIAMYRVKDEQRNAIRFYAPEMQAEANRRVLLEHDLRRALQRDEFRVFVQPQYDAARRMVGCEVLLRWPHREGRMISPAAFVPIAEETGLIVALGEWVLRSSARLIRQLAVAGEKVSVSVNVSPRQFQEANFVERVRTILQESGADAGRLILEITEGLVVADFADAHIKLSQLKSFGVRLAIDDFGTGHSSLAYLKRLPLHELKIDRTFIKDLPHDSSDAALVEAMLAMSRHLQLDVVAEGVETAEQFAFLKRRGCQRFQGYHFGAAQPPEEYFHSLKAVPAQAHPDR